MSPTIRFPDDFLWGAATSAYQIEGAPTADGAGPSNWHHFAHTPGNITDGSTGDVACDHYHRYREDVEIMRRLELDAYRFSLAWSRIVPDGRGEVNRGGLDFYNRLVDYLLELGIQPCVTLHHWDWPGSLEESGGWLAPEMPDRFADFARVAFRELGDRVSMWSTINEPWVIAHAGYFAGTNAPGHRDLAETAIVSHHLLKAHGLAVQSARSEGIDTIGLVVNLEPKYAASDSPDDRAAAERGEVYMNRQFLDPVMLGRNAEGLSAAYGDSWREISAEDLEIISAPVDYLGINYYTRKVVRHDHTAPPDYSAAVHQSKGVYTETGWEVYPEGLTRTLVGVKERYGDIPLYITENGAAFADPAGASNDRIEDPLRVEYYCLHLAAAHEAMARGVDLRGYFAWSLLDNMEWSSGYTKRFGLVHVDFETQRRTLKESARFYREVIRSGGSILGSGGDPGGA